MPISIISFNGQMGSKTSISFIAITIAILVLLYTEVYLPETQTGLAFSFNLNNLPCVLIHGGHVHCTEDYLPETQTELASIYYHSFNLNNLPCVLIHGGHIHCA
jgi:hypothetical protein